jgi:menaquinone-9 beta-reductase
MDNFYDLIVVGAGPAGCSAAINLARENFKVLIVEQKFFPRDKLCGEFISTECLTYFQQLGVDEPIYTNGATISKTVLYSRSGRSVSIPTKWFGCGDAIGLSRAQMDYLLLRQAKRLGVDSIEGIKVTKPIIESNRVVGVELKIEGKSQKIYATIVVDATGRNRILARNFDDQGRDKKRVELVAFKAHVNRAYGAYDSCELYFYKGGYGGLNYVENGVSNLCFIASSEEVRRCKSIAERVMQEVVMTNSRAAKTLSNTQICSEWSSVALDSFGLRDPSPTDGLIVVGDAASTIDPFTGSGILMALESGDLSARLIIDWLKNNRDRNSHSVLRASYKHQYRNLFNKRLRLSSLLRTLAFGPAWLSDIVILALNLNKSSCRKLAIATRYRRTDL